MPYSRKEIERIKLRAKWALGQLNRKDANDKRIFLSQCVDSMTSSGDAEDEDEAREICLLLWDEGEELADYD